VSWTLHCDSSGDSVITVTAAGTDVNTGSAIVAANIARDSVTVHQQTPCLGGGAIAGIAIEAAAVAFLRGFLAARRKKKGKAEG